MVQIFNAFLAGKQAADEDKQQYARTQAGKALAAGDGKFAENVLVGQGLNQEAMQLGQIAQQRKRADLSKKIGPQLAEGKYAPAAAEAFGAGELELGAQLLTLKSQMSAEQRAEMAANAQEFGRLALSLKGNKEVAPEQRAAWALQAIAGTPYDNEQFRARLEQYNADGVLTDDELDRTVRESMTVADVMARDERQERYAVEDKRWGAEYAQRERLAGMTGPSNFDQGDVRQWGQAYDNEQQQASNELGILGPSLGYAYTAIANSGDTTKVAGLNYRQADVALLRAAARAQTGPGVLQQSEVWDTLSPSVQQSLLKGLSYGDKGFSTLTPSDRASLAGFVVRQAEQSTRRAWNLYSDYEARLARFGQTPQQMGLRPPMLPHPDDTKALNNPKMQYQPGKEYVAPSGRTYVNQGPGAWTFTRFGGKPQEGWTPPPSSGGGVATAGPPPANAIAYLRANPGQAAAFEAKYPGYKASSYLPKKKETPPGRAIDRRFTDSSGVY